jgi:hypothetical protein
MAKSKKRLTRKQRKAKKLTEVAPHWTPFERKELPPEARGIPMTSIADELWVNSRYHVFVRFVRHPDVGELTHLSIKHNDKSCPRDWRELQRIKNELCGPEREALEIYPAESRLVDMSNQFHLWVMPAGKLIPFGFFDGRCVTDEALPNGKQRAFEQETELTKDRIDVGEAALRE